jgi:hypothetical protein
MFGSGRAILSLRDSYRRDLRTMKSATDIHYVRFHAIFDDEVGVYRKTPRGSRSTIGPTWIRSMTACSTTAFGRSSK